MKKSVWIFVFIVAIAATLLSQFPKLYVATGYGAKCMASGIFVANRTPEDIKNNDLDYSIVKYTSHSINYIEKRVTTTIFGLAKQTAIFREGLGCCLLGESAIIDTNIRHSLSVPIYKSFWNQEWPAGDLRSNCIDGNIDTVKLNSAIDQAFDKPGSNIKRTAAVVVAYKGKLIGEKYWKEQHISDETRLWGWSMNKSILNAMIGILIRQKKLNLNASAPVIEWIEDPRRNITINDLLQMSSGLKWNEDYGKLSDVTTMLYKKWNCYEYAISFPFENDAGSIWKYSSGSTNILSGIIRKSIANDEKYHLFPYNELFNKIGMSSMILETDLSGHFVASSYGYATAKDWARFGQLYLQDGVWRGDTILPKGWVKYSSTAAPKSKGKYGALFWLNSSLDLPDVPSDMFCCEGHRGQRIFIIPSKELIIVRLGFAEDHFNHNLFVKSILGAFKPLQ